MAANVSNTSRIMITRPFQFRCYHPKFPANFQYQYFKITHTVAVPLNVICFLLYLIANTLILMSVYRRRRLRAPSSLLLYSLNLKDITFVALAQALQIYKSLVFLSEDNFCHPTQVGDLSLFVVFCGRAIGLISMIVISIDRCFAIHKPHIYRRCLNKKRVFIVVAVVWLISIAIGAVSPFLKIQALSTLMMMLFGGTAVLVTLLQLSVYYGVKRQRSRISEMNSTQLGQVAMERAVATVVFYIILGLALCYIPFLSSVALMMFNGKNYVYFGRIWFQFSIYLNALINPIVMLKTNRKLRAAVVHTASPCFVCCQHFVWNEGLVVDSVSKNDRQPRTGTRLETKQQSDKTEENNSSINIMLSEPKI